MRRHAIDLDASLFQRRIRTTLVHCIRSFVIFFLVSTFVLYSGLEWRFLTLYNTIPIWDPYSLIHPFSHSLQGLLHFSSVDVLSGYDFVQGESLQSMYLNRGEGRHPRCQYIHANGVQQITQHYP